MLQKVRKQNFNMTLATHLPEDFDEPVRNALMQAAIQARGQSLPFWDVSLDNAEAVRVKVPPMRFRDYPQMTDPQWSALLHTMRLQFNTRRPAVAPRSHPQSSDEELAGPAKY